MQGFFEFSLMRVRHDIDQKILSELFYEYLNVEEDFIRQLFTQVKHNWAAPLSMTALSEENALFVLDYERATEIIRNTPHRPSAYVLPSQDAPPGQIMRRPARYMHDVHNTAASLIRHNIAGRWIHRNASICCSRHTSTDWSSSGEFARAG
jgi:hypothetical protein